MMRRIELETVIARIPNPMSTSFLNIPRDVTTTNRAGPFYPFDIGNEDLNRFTFLATQT